MSTFFAALIAVSVLLLTAAPGYVFIKRRMLSSECMPGFSKLLLFVCQPALAVYTFSVTPFSKEKLGSLGIFILAVILIHGVMLSIACLAMRKRFSDVRARISTISVTFANCAFFGIPVIEAVMGDAAAELIIYTTVYALVMNILGWTVGSAVISGSGKYITAKNIVLNPATVGVLVALPIFIFSIDLPSQLSNMIMILGKMTTPLSMIILGMRLATTKLSSVFGSPKAYISVAVKLILMPLLAFGLIYFFPLATEVKETFYIICACPTASIVLNFSEIVGEGQKEAAASVLLSTILSILSLPLIVLMLPLL